MKKLLMLLAVLLLLCTHSWGSCSIISSAPYWTGYDNGVTKNGITCTLGSGLNCTGSSGITKNPSSCTQAGAPTSGQTYCVLQSDKFTSCCYGCTPYRWYPSATCFSCTTQAEADSASCALNPTAEGCVVETDTTLFACSDDINGSGNGALYRLSCRAKNGEVISCNGKTSVDVATDGTLVRPLQGTCAQNGFEAGIIGGATADTSSPKSANADCFAVIGSTCHMKDKASGNTFRCECDGSCNVALRNLMAGNADCTNPYPQPNDSLHIGSSASSSPSSSEGSSPSSSEGSSASSSPSGESSSSDFEFDYTDVLNNIQANTQQTATEVGRSNEFLNDIKNNTYTANGLLQQLVNKDWSPTINVQAPNVNVTVNGDTAHAPAEILALLQQGGANSSDTAGLGSQLDFYVGKMDSAIGEGVPDMSDSIPAAMQGVKSTFDEFKDSLAHGAMSDSLSKWEGVITDNGVITGAGSDNCPSILTEPITIDFPIIGTVQGGTWGKYLCEPIQPFSVTLWAFVRVIIRAVVAIGCMFWLYKAVLGIDRSSSDED